MPYHVHDVGPCTDAYCHPSCAGRGKHLICNQIHPGQFYCDHQLPDDGEGGEGGESGGGEE
jgi:hypothetical protein